MAKLKNFNINHYLNYLARNGVNISARNENEVTLELLALMSNMSNEEMTALGTLVESYVRQHPKAAP